MASSTKSNNKSSYDTSSRTTSTSDSSSSTSSDIDYTKIRSKSNTLPSEQHTSTKQILTKASTESSTKDISVGMTSSDKSHRELDTALDTVIRGTLITASSTSSSSEDESLTPTNTSKKLDIFSKEFDPLLALYSNDFIIPTPSASILDNVEAFAARYEGKAKGRGRGKRKDGEEGESSKVDPSTSQEQPVPQRMFTPDQMPVQGKRREFSNVLKFMKKQSDKGGPMAILENCIQTGRRIKIFIRGIDRMRGYCIGTLIAFDKHWNFALVDVDEVYTRKRVRKVPPVADEKLNQQFSDLMCKTNSISDSKKSNTTISGHEKSTGRKHDDTKREQRRSSFKKPPRTEIVGASVTRIEKIKRKTEVCSRHVPQLIIRGEHVASVNIL